MQTWSNDRMKGIVLALGGLAFVAGCGDMGSKPADTPAASKVAKLPYHIEFDSKAAKPGVALPPINYTADPKAELERRAVLVVRFDPGEKKGKVGTDQMIMGPGDVAGTSGTLAASYMELANKGLAQMLGDACMKGTVKVTVALVRSSVKPDASDAEIDGKRLSDWLPIDVPYKNPHPKC
jgi:hypothetical protein